MLNYKQSETFGTVKLNKGKFESGVGQKTSTMFIYVNNFIQY